MNARVADTASGGNELNGELLRRARAARVYDVAHETALGETPLLSARLGARVLLKREDRRTVFSFKLRGAYNRMVRLDAAQRARGVIAAPPAIMRKAWRLPRQSSVFAPRP